MDSNELVQMMKVADVQFDRKYSALSDNVRDQIKGEARINYLKKFNTEKAKGRLPERNFYENVCLLNALSNWYRKETELMKDENGNPQLDETGKEIRKSKIPIVELNINTDSDTDSDDESNMNKDMEINDDGTHIKLSEDSSEMEELSAEYTLDKHILEKFKWYFKEGLPKEIFTYYLLSKKIKTRGYYKQPLIKKEYKPTKDSIPYPDIPEYYYLSSESKEALRRLQYLKNAENRRWMEMAINEMRISKEKLETYIAGWDKAKQKKFREDTPILSSIILNKEGKLIASCYKGKVTRTHTNRAGITKDVTFDNHCEFSLFTDIIGEKNLHLVKDGILYVTLEPCNKRGFWLDADIEAPKLPCAVRCVEAGLKKVFIGTKDDNKNVEDKGIAILTSGKYVFKLKHGKLDGTEKEIKEEGLLEAYFKTKNYASEDIGDERIYTIGSSIEVELFDADLMEEVRLLNSEFLQRHSPKKFYS